jgi:hypothetical protein
MCCCCCSLSAERAGVSMVPGLATLSEICFNTQHAASTCTMPRQQSKPTQATFLKGPSKQNSARHEHLTKGCPQEQTPSASLTKLSTQFKAPYTSSECDELDCISKPLTFARIWHSGGFCGARCPVRSVYPLRQGKCAILKLP